MIKDVNCTLIAVFNPSRLCCRQASSNDRRTCW